MEKEKRTEQYRWTFFSVGIFLKEYRICLGLPHQLTLGSVKKLVSRNSLLFIVYGGRLLTNLFRICMQTCCYCYAIGQQVVVVLVKEKRG